jgi:nucleolar GTP-binding protein
MFKIPTILMANELLDKAYHKAGKITEKTKIRDKVKRRKIVVLSKIDAVADVIDSTLGKYISAFPSFNQLHEFEFELIDLRIGVDKLRKSLGTLDWARKQVQNFRSEICKTVRRIYSIKDYPKLDSHQRSFYGRVSSVFKQISSDLDFLNSARDHLKKLPAIDPEKPTIVIAGYPNVGKSLLVKQISSAKPAIASYPFTTQQLNIGHMLLDKQLFQIIDTPGILDRPFEKRNKIERQAIMALRHLANVIIFILDPSEHCGYSIDEQNRLLEEISNLFPQVKIIEIENKMDILSSKTGRLKVSAKHNQGLEELLEVVQEAIISESENQKPDNIESF